MGWVSWVRWMNWMSWVNLGELGGHSLLGLVLGLIFKYFLLTDWGATPSPLMIENFLQKSL